MGGLVWAWGYGWPGMGMGMGGLVWAWVAWYGHGGYVSRAGTTVRLSNNKGISHKGADEIVLEFELTDELFVPHERELVAVEVAAAHLVGEGSATWRCDRDCAEIAPRCGREISSARNRPPGDATEIVPRCDRDLRRDCTEMRPILRRDFAEIVPRNLISDGSPT